MLSRHVIASFALGATLCAQQTSSPIDTATMDCRTMNQISQTNARLTAQNPQALLGLTEKMKPVLDACVAFQAETNAETAAKVIAAMGDYNPQTLPVSQRLAKLEAQADGAEGLRLFYMLAPLAKAAFEAGDLVKARSYADQLLTMAPQFPKDWNYGNAVYYGHMVLGRVELAQGNTALAESHLLQSAHTPGSPQLNSFGPNTSLAKDLLERGDTAPVLQYFTLIQNFWKMSRGKPADWAAEVQAGKIPNFGANLSY
ncbi:MAG TPA: hypothetical protein VKB88_13385 [Bryobacteraceae bacterium]|nr:hypothetical protein [Bryobacteraceae bacterium]